MNLIKPGEREKNPQRCCRCSVSDSFSKKCFMNLIQGYPISLLKQVKWEKKKSFSTRFSFLLYNNCYFLHNSQTVTRLTQRKKERSAEQ